MTLAQLDKRTRFLRILLRLNESTSMRHADLVHDWIDHQPIGAEEWYWSTMNRFCPWAFTADGHPLWQCDRIDLYALLQMDDD